MFMMLCPKRIKPEKQKILRENKNGFQRNRSTTLLIQIIQKSRVRVENLEVTLLFVDFFKGFDSIPRRKGEQILLSYGIPIETVTATMLLYKNTKTIAR